MGELPGRIIAEMQHGNDTIRQGLALPEERRRLVRLCARITRDPQSAEDLAQETLLEAWAHADRLRNPDAWQAWLSGIAVNACRRWLRRHSRERRQFPGAWEPEEALWEKSAARDVPFDMTLERTETEVVLHQALALLPPETRWVLTRRYFDDLSAAEIAAQTGWSPNVVAVRLHRGRQALRQALASRLHREASACGLILEEQAGWRETAVWCPRCGTRRLQGRLIACGGSPDLRTRCPGCGDGPETTLSTAHAALDTSVVLGSAKSFKPALRRVIAWWCRYLRGAIADGRAACPRCGRSAPVTPGPGAGGGPLPAGWPFLSVGCEACQTQLRLGPGEFAFVLPEVQQFWRRHPRMRRLVPALEIAAAGRRAVRVAFECRTGPARLEVTLAYEAPEALHILEI
jgi:RNA polymerase sigma-70 factor (ECF subfamily)